MCFLRVRRMTFEYFKPPFLIFSMKFNFELVLIFTLLEIKSTSYALIFLTSRRLTLFKNTRRRGANGTGSAYSNTNRVPDAA
jgi:hypothetical protein